MHCRAVATIAQYLPQVSTRLRAWFDWLQSVIPANIRTVPYKSPQQLQTSVARLTEQLLLFFCLAYQLACHCPWLAVALGSDHHASGESLPIPRSLCTHFLPSIVGER